VRQIYLDYNATTPIAANVIEAMLPFLQTHYGNPSSSHMLGRASREAIEEAREKVAKLLGCDSDEIVFTSCGTESNNLAIKGVMLAGLPQSRGHLIISALEHAAVTQPARFLERIGYDLTIVPCDRFGVVNPRDVQRALRPNTRLVSIIHANNEVGTIQPIAEIAEICHEQSILLHTDAAQSVGKIPTFVEDLKVDLLTLAGHKIYAPKGIGALFIRKGVVLEPLLHGASQEWGMRGGTLNTAYIVGLGQAANRVAQQLEKAAENLAALRDRLERLLGAEVPGLIVNGQGRIRLPNTSSLSFPQVNAFEMLKRIPELCASLGTACHSDGYSISSTLSAMGCSQERAQGTIRLSLGWQTTQEEIDRAASLLVDAWETLAKSHQV
jgi:cysteine desulfurase